MDEELAEDLDDPESMENIDFEPARFSSDLGLPSVDASILDDASYAVRQEFRNEAKWKRLNCKEISVLSEQGRGTVYAIHLDVSFESDWTWEGAFAFRPQSLEDNEDSPNSYHENIAHENEALWSGEIVEVDEQNNCLFITLEDSENPPQTGAFFVRPFEFLSVLDAVYNEPAFEEVRTELPARLEASKGNIHPQIAETCSEGLPHLTNLWKHSWSILWGPPGTGKTYTTGLQIASILDDQTERILVVSTTNRATDAVALSIGDATRTIDTSYLENGEILRIGKGASAQRFKANHLEELLEGTESELLSKIESLTHDLKSTESSDDKAFARKKISELRSKTNDQSKLIFFDPDVRVVISTAFKAMSFLNDSTIRKLIENGDAPFTTIFIDEAGLISRTAVAALSLLAAKRVVLVGDSKQLAPISRITRILTTRQQTWLASSGLSHLDEIEETPSAVHVLSEQRRMHPDVCKIVSNYQYDGFLKTAKETIDRESTLPTFISDYSRAIWYVLDEEDSDLVSIRAKRGQGNNSWMRSITPDILQKLFSESSVRQSKGLFISPFKAQAQSISKRFSNWDLPNWEASTVHSQQGSEADIVIFDTVNASSYSWPFEEWKRLTNVALSRAREAVIVLASRSEMEEPYLKSLTAELTPSILVQQGATVRWQKVDLKGGNTHNSGHDPSKQKEKRADNSLGGQIANRQSMKPILSEEQQRLTNLKLDGKPRLVRGVAGSGKSIVLCNWLAKTVKRMTDTKDFHVWAVYANRSLHKLLRESVESAWSSMSDGELFDEGDFPWESVSLLHIKDVLTEILPIASLTMNRFEFDYDRAAEEFLNCHDQSEMLPRCSALFIDEAQDMGPSTLKLLLSLVEQTDLEDPNSRSAHIFYDNAQNIYGRKTPKWTEFGLDMRGRSTIMRESFRSTTPVTELAINILNQLTPKDKRQDQQELIEMGLVERTQNGPEEWLKIRYNQISGPNPIFHSFDDRQTELDAIFRHLKHLITEEKISPCDICLIYNSNSAVQLLESKLGPLLSKINVELSVQTNRAFERRPNTLIVTTSHSYKGYESEVVLIPCVDQYVTGDGQILANNLYVAMTRARSLLAIYGVNGNYDPSQILMKAIGRCVEVQSG
ncbi:AAA domain-containing protein [Gimesia chilikensis]|uniref:ATP-dependent RecD-like DNA helicase n=1 Tax=Gimesia chilikensis TaxID=2605989 RepID=A0A517PY93_9PLAN|nr:AAA domain-containing protein [Gimesia chilikensis]QDT24355.1 ATP-dependent RecD-like DNA helicase [Gimesia chilikensis]